LSHFHGDFSVLTGTRYLARPPYIAQKSIPEDAAIEAFTNPKFEVDSKPVTPLSASDRRDRF